MNVSFGAAAEDYANFRAGFPDSLFDRLNALGIGQRNQIVADVGTGTGTLARGFARRGMKVIAIDPDERLLVQAKRLDARASVSIDYRSGTAEALPLGDEVVDVVTAGQCWHWFNGPVAARETARVLRRSGYVVVAHLDWLPWQASVVDLTERLIVAHNPAWRSSGGDGFHPESIPDLRAAGFGAFQSFSYEVDVGYTPSAWRGRIRASAGVASLSQGAADAFDAELARALSESFPEPILHVPHRVFAVVARLGGAAELQVAPDVAIATARAPQ